MTNGTRRTRWAVGLMAALMLALVVVVATPQLSGAAPGGAGWGDDLGRGGMHAGAIDHDALLAEALGITVEELEAARAKANEAALALAVQEGLIDQDQADMRLAMAKLKPYLDRDVLMAEALGITVEELQAARDEGKSTRDLIDELGIDEETLQENLAAARTAAIEQAVADGVITQEQADKLLSDEGHLGVGIGGRHGGRGMPGEPGEPGEPGGPGGRGGKGGRFGEGNGPQDDLTVPSADEVDA